MTKHASLAPLLERFFTQRLMQQRQASPHTISSYRDTFRQLLKFAERTLHKPPSRLNFEEVNVPLIVAFLDDLENHQVSTSAAVTCASRRFILSFATRPSRHPSILPKSNACLQSPVSASLEPSSIS